MAKNFNVKVQLADGSVEEIVMPARSRKRAESRAVLALKSSSRERIIVVFYENFCHLKISMRNQRLNIFSLFLF